MPVSFKIRIHGPLHSLMGFRLFWTIILLFICTLVHTQEKQTIAGTALDMESSAPLPGAHILVQGSSYGTISGPDGSFSLLVSSFPVTLIVTHVGYEERWFEITESIKDEHLMLGMKFKAELLEGVTITDEKVELIFKSESYSVLDFEFHQNGLMLLIYRNMLKKAELVLLSYFNDTLSKYTNLPGRADHLDKDCMDYIHYLTTDSAYQIDYTGNELRLIYPVNLETFNIVINTFSGIVGHNYYFGLYRFQDQVLDYIRYNELTDEYLPFKTIVNQKNLQIMKDNPKHRSLMNNLVSDRNIQKDMDLFLMQNNTTIDKQREELKKSRDASIEAHYLKTCVYYPVCAPLFSYGKQIIIFNHPESKIEFLDQGGKVIDSVDIDYQKNKSWERYILHDEIQGEYYCVFNNENRLTINKINLEDGSLGSDNIMAYPYIKKILVRNGYAYFTYRQPGSIERTMLFRQKLKFDNLHLAETD